MINHEKKSCYEYEHEALGPRPEIYGKTIPIAEQRRNTSK